MQTTAVWEGLSIVFSTTTYQGKENADEDHGTKLQVCQHDQCEKEHTEQGQRHVSQEFNVNHFVHCPIEVLLKSEIFHSFVCNLVKFM